MRKLFLLILLFAGLISVQSCISSKENNIYTIGIDLQSDFENDMVSVEIDGQNVFRKKVTTNIDAGMAESIQTKFREGVHTIRISVNGVTKTDQVNLTRCQFLGVNYFSAIQKININYYNQPFSYN